MKLELNNREIIKCFKNVYDVKLCDDGSIWPVRFTDRIFSVYNREEHLSIRSSCPSGVCLELTTDSSFITLSINVLNFARDFAYFDLFIDDVFTETIGAEPVSSLSDEVTFRLYNIRSDKVKSYKKKQKITIYLPHLVNMRIKDIELEDGSTAEACYDESRHKKSLLCLGDSITQGMTGKKPSSAYPVQLAEILKMNMLNQGVGAYVYNEEALDEEMNIKPDIITVAYGVNEWLKYDSVTYFREMCRGFFSKLTEIYPEARIFAITPIWHVGEDEPNSMGYLSDIRKEIAAIAEQYKAVQLIDGLKLVPNMPEYYVDGIHPTDLGLMHYSLNLIKEIR